MSYQESEGGPFGIQLSQELGRTMRTNTAFSQMAWENAKQDGCLPCPGRRLPSWPPCGNFIYPTLDKEKQTVLGAHQYDPNLKDCPEAAPWQTDAPKKNSLTCAMTRANNFLNAQPGYDPKTAFNYSNLEQDTDMASQVAQSILQGTIPMHSCDSANPSEQYFGDSLNSEEKDNGVLSENEYSLRNLFPCIANTWTGIAYDMAHYDDLSVDSGDTNEHQAKIEYVVMRDDRFKYVITTGLLFLLVVLLIAAVISTSMGAASTASKNIQVGQKVFDLSKLGIDNLDDMQIIIRSKK